MRCSSTPVAAPTSLSIASSATPTTYRGTFQPSIGSSGEAVALNVTGLAAGSWDVRATFSDVLGGTVTKTKRINVLDKTPPAGSVKIAGGAVYTKTAAVTIAVPATDAGSERQPAWPCRTTGTAWTTRPYAATQPWTLPATNGTRTVYAKWRDRAGNWSAVASDTIVLDTVAPSRYGTRSPLVDGHVHQRGSHHGPPELDKTATATSGIARYELRQSTDGGAFASVSTALTSASLDRLAGGPVTHIASRCGRSTGPATPVCCGWTGSTFRLTHYSETDESGSATTGTWATTRSTAFWGGQAKRSSTAGARATISVTGRSVVWIARKGPDRGRAQVYVNGVLKGATVDLYASTYQGTSASCGPATGRRGPPGPSRSASWAPPAGHGSSSTPSSRRTRGRIERRIRSEARSTYPESAILCGKVGYRHTAWRCSAWSTPFSNGPCVFSPWFGKCWRSS